MGYTFKLKRNIFMYNHLLTVSDGKEHYEAIIESLPTKHESMGIWLEDFGFSKENLVEAKCEMINWFSGLNIECVFYEGKGR